jgi:hypothetical protein
MFGFCCLFDSWHPFNWPGEFNEGGDLLPISGRLKRRLRLGATRLQFLDVLGRKTFVALRPLHGAVEAILGLPNTGGCRGLGYGSESDRQW